MARLGTFAVQVLAGVAGALLVTAAGAQAPPVYRANTIEPYHAKTIEVYRAHTVQPYRARRIQTYRSGQVQLYSSHSTVHLFTPAERARMLENDRRAGRTAASVRRGRYAAPNLGGCAPNCGYDYSTGRSLPTIYNPNSGDYSAVGH